MAEKKKDTKAEVKEEGIKVINEDGILRIEDGNDFVEGKVKLSFGLKRKIKNLASPKKMTVKGENDPVTMYMDEYDDRNDVDLYILDKTLTDWSSPEKLNWRNIKNEEELVGLMEKYVEEFKKVNGLVKNKADEEKKSE